MERACCINPQSNTYPGRRGTLRTALNSIGDKLRGPRQGTIIHSKPPLPTSTPPPPSTTTINQMKEKQSSKYMDSLKRVAEQRKMEREIARDRLIMKEQEKEKEIYGETESYVTSSYLKKMQERKQFEEEQKKLQVKERDVTTQGMTSFYSNLLSNLDNQSQKPTIEKSKPIDKPIRTKSPPRQERPKEDRKRKSVSPPREEENTPTIQPEKVSKIDKTETINAARERYLQRMAAKQSK